MGYAPHIFCELCVYARRSDAATRSPRCHVGHARGHAPRCFAKVRTASLRTSLTCCVGARLRALKGLVVPNGDNEVYTTAHRCGKFVAPILSLVMAADRMPPVRGHSTFSPLSRVLYGFMCRQLLSQFHCQWHDASRRYAGGGGGGIAADISTKLRMTLRRL